MRTYLKEFFETFAFEKADAQCLLGCFDSVQAHPEAMKLWDEALSLYEQDLNCDYVQVMELGRQATALAGYHYYTGDLLLYCCLSRQLKAYYIEKGIDLEIFHNSVLDLRYKLDECKIVKGICGSFVAKWFAGFFNMTRFALGRLQFEIKPLGMEYTKDGHMLTEQHKVINMHIPRDGTPMDPERCDAAIRRAKEFFDGQWSEPCTFYCDSWLLYPAHKDILPCHTNVYKFMERFEIVQEKVDLEGKNLWRLFDTEEKNPDRLPADSSMRRNYIQYLKQGKYPGIGKGIFFL